MKRITIPALLVVGLISVDISFTVASADLNKTKTTIFKVNKVTPGDTLKLRAWPSPKSRIKAKLPYNAKDLTETGKKRVINNTPWVEVNWNNDKGWVNANYLKKTGVLLRKQQTASRNVNAKQKIVEVPKIKPVKTIDDPVKSLNDQQEFAGDRYDQPVQVSVAKELKMAYSGNAVESTKNLKDKLLRCQGNSPKPWGIVINTAKRTMQINLSKNNKLSVPINYHAWATPNKIRISMGGNKGRNTVDVNLEKTDACNNGLSKTNYPYQVNATINRTFVSGCCDVVNP